MNKKRSSLIVLLLLALAILSLACAVTRKEPAADVEQGMIKTAVAVAQTAASSDVAVTSVVPEVTVAPAATEAPPASEPSPAPPSPLQAVFTDASHNLWIWQDGGAAQQLDSSGDVDFGILSDDGAQVAYVRTADYARYSLWVVNANGSNKRQLLSHEQLLGLLSEPGHETLTADMLSYTIGNMPNILQWLPNSSVLSFTSTPRHDGPGLMIVGDVYQLDTSTGVHTLVLNTTNGGLPAYSPDGSLMAVVTPQSISLANADGTNYHANLINFPAVITYSEYMYYPEVVWAADSSHFKVIIPPADPLAPAPLNAQIWQVNADGSAGTQVGNVSNFVPFVWPQLSPDLSRVVYERTSGAPADNLHELHNASVGGAEDLLVYTGSLGFVSHHPDSQHFIFWRDEPTNYQLAQLGGSFAPLTDTGNARSVKWISADSFLFFNFTGSSWQIRRQTIGSPSTVLIEFPGTKDFSPSLDLSGGLE